MYSSLLQKLPIAIAGLLLLAAIVTIYFRSKNVTRSEFLKIFKSTKFITVPVVIFVIIITVVFGVFNRIKAKQSVSAVVSLNFPEASMAHNSNGTRYNMNEIICDEVIEKAIKMGAFENVTVKQLKDCLYVYPYVQGDVSDKANYHISTEFVVGYVASKHTQHLDSENVIKLITGAYKEYYIEKYTDKFDLTLEAEKPDYSTMEYMDILSYFDKESSAVLNYLYGMATKAPSFVTSNNTTFHSIAGKILQFRETQIQENFGSLILQHGISRNTEGYIDRLAFQNKNTDFNLQKSTSSFNLCNRAIDMYSEDMTRIVLVPTWDESGKYYMGRTKVGIDELSVMATGFSEDVAENEKSIMNNELIIGKMQNPSGNVSAREKADELIITIDKGIDDFIVEAINAGREYSSYAMNQCISVSISGVSLFSRIKSVIIIALFAYFAAILYSVSKKFPKA